MAQSAAGRLHVPAIRGNEESGREAARVNHTDTRKGGFVEAREPEGER